MDEVRLEHIDHVVEVSERVIDGNHVNFATVKSSLGDRVPKMAKAKPQPALHKKMQLSVERGGIESLGFEF